MTPITLATRAALTDILSEYRAELAAAEIELTDQLTVGAVLADLYALAGLPLPPAVERVLAAVVVAA